jgi:hypothetical protein
MILSHYELLSSIYYRYYGDLNPTRRFMSLQDNLLVVEVSSPRKGSRELSISPSPPKPGAGGGAGHRTQVQVGCFRFTSCRTIHPHGEAVVKHWPDDDKPHCSTSAKKYCLETQLGLISQSELQHDS